MARAVADITKRSTAVNFTLPVGLLADVDQLAARQGMSRSQLLRKLIEEALELDQVDLQLAAEAKQRLADEEDVAVTYAQARTELGL
jgi:predicted DNA-binding protein